jgi:hypothetical protein
MNDATAASAALYNAQSARMLGWTTSSKRALGVFSGPDDLRLPLFISRFQTTFGIAPDGRVTPETLRKLIEIGSQTMLGTNRLFDGLLLGNANPDAAAPTPAPTPAPKMPAWVLPAVAVAVVGVLLLRRR